MIKKYYISTEDESEEDIIYKSDLYNFNEIDLLNLIKICLVEGRNKYLGKKILEVYRDSTMHKKEEANKLLENIGVKENGSRETTTARNPKFK